MEIGCIFFGNPYKRRDSWDSEGSRIVEMKNTNIKTDDGCVWPMRRVNKFYGKSNSEKSVCHKVLR